MNRTISLIALGMVVAGCTNARISRSFSAGQTGCPANEVVITNETASGPMGGLHNWEADCRGKHFFCSYEQTAGAHCKEALPQ